MAFRILVLILFLGLVLAAALPDVALADAPCDVLLWIDVAGQTSLSPGGVDLQPGTPLSLVARLTCTVATEVHLAFGTAEFATGTSSAGTTDPRDTRPPCPSGIFIKTYTDGVATEDCLDNLIKDPRVRDAIKKAVPKAVDIALLRGQEDVVLAANVPTPFGLPDVIFVGAVIAPVPVTGDLIYNAITNPSAVPDARSSAIRCVRQNIGQPHNCRNSP